MEADNPFDINPGRLDTECRQQATQSRAAGVREADARHAHAQAKAALDVVVAKLSLAIRQNPAKFRLGDRPTVDAIDASVKVEPEYQAAVALVNQTKWELDVATAETNAYVDRRKMIERLVDLIQLDYAVDQEPTPKTPQGRERMDRAQIRDRVGEGADRRTREE